MNNKEITIRIMQELHKNAEKYPKLNNYYQGYCRLVTAVDKIHYELIVDPGGEVAVIDTVVKIGAEVFRILGDLCPETVQGPDKDTMGLNKLWKWNERPKKLDNGGK